MVFYFVQRGETLYAIARRYQTTVHAIVTANRLEDPNTICAGQALLIPRPGEVPSPPPGGIVHLVRAGETVFGLSAKFGATPHDILRANQIAHPEFILPGQQLVIPEPMEAGDDWPMLGRTPGRVGSGPVVLRGTPQDGWSFAPRRCNGVMPSAPVIRYDRVFVGLGDGNFYSLDRNGGRIKWRWTAGEPSELDRLAGQALAAPLVFDGLAYLCCPGGDVIAVDAYTGRQIWRVATGGVITSSPVPHEGIVYFGSWDGQVYALEAKTGAIAWKRTFGSQIKLPLAIGDDHVFAMGEDGLLWSLDAQTGESRWQTAVPELCAPVFAEVVVLVGGRAHDPTTGSLLWEVQSDGALPIARLDQIIFSGGVVDLFTGQQVRAMNTPDLSLRQSVASGPVVLGVGSDERLYARDLADGRVVWARTMPAVCHQPPAVAVSQVALSLADGSLQTYRFQEDNASI